jgi:hypothetical protein
MANEISLTCKATVSKGGTTITNATSTKSVDMSGTGMFHANMIMHATAGSFEQLDTQFTDVSSAAEYWVLARNMDTAAVVLLACTGAVTYPIASIPPGSFVMTRLPAAADVYASSTVALSELEVLAWEV